MKKLTLVLRILMGLIFVASAIAYLTTTPPPLEGPIAKFNEGVEAARYFLPLVKGTEFVCGLLLISGRFVPLALVALAAIILNIFMVHLFMVPEGLPLALVLGALEIYLAFFSREYSPTIKELFKAKPTPSA